MTTPPPQSPEQVRLILDRPAYGGDSIGRLPDGRAVFVPFTIPGEEVRLRIVEEKRNLVRGELVEVITPSPQRIQPACRHFGVCGGCHYQHIDYEGQLALKQAILTDQLTRIGGIAQPKVLPARPSQQVWRYRNTAQFHQAADGRPAYIAQDGVTRMVIEECPLLGESIDAVWPQLAIEPLEGLERIAVREDSDGNVLIALESSDPQPHELELDLDVSVVHLGPQGIDLLAGNPLLYYDILGRQFSISAAAFFQVNTAMAAEMVSTVLELLPLGPDKDLLELYSGAGLFSAFLAGRCRSLTAVEFSPEACRDFEDNLDEFDNVSLYIGPAAQIVPNLDLRPHAVLADPPRAGLERPVLQAILRMQPAQIVYVSCDPSTLARDAKHLTAGGYRLVHTTPFDLFPHTYHIESISLFER